MAAPSLTDEREIFLKFKETRDAGLREAIIEKYGLTLVNELDI